MDNQTGKEGPGRLSSSFSGDLVRLIAEADTALKREDLTPILAGLWADALQDAAWDEAQDMQQAMEEEEDAEQEEEAETPTLVRGVSWLTQLGATGPGTDRPPVRPRPDPWYGIAKETTVGTPVAHVPTRLRPTVVVLTVEEYDTLLRRARQGWLAHVVAWLPTLPTALRAAWDLAGQTPVPSAPPAPPTG